MKAKQPDGKIASLKVERLPLAKLKPHPQNPRHHPDPDSPDWNALKASLQNDYFDPVVFNRRNQKLVRGHLRVKVLDSLGYKAADAVVVSYDEATHVARMIAANRLAGSDDEAALAALLNAMDGERLLTGMAEDDIAELLKSMEPQSDVDAKPQIDLAAELQKEWGTERGQLWKLGEHRLLCGCMESADDVKRVLNGDVLQMIFTDPPYGHKNNDGDLIHNWELALGKPKTASSEARPIANDGAEEAARVFTALCKLASELLPPGCCCCCCCCGGGGPDPQFARWSLEIDRAVGFKHAVVWDKGGLGMGWHYRRCYEMVLVAEKPGAACHWFGGNDVPNVIRDIGKIIPSADQHPTEKPVELPAWFIRLHSQPVEIVFDPFAGSGSSIIACEQLHRRCRAIEIDPGYVAVTLQRFKDATGKKPKLVKP